MADVPEGPRGSAASGFVTEVNGRPATLAELSDLAFAGYGHFTSMQVRAYRVRGLDLHLDRLRRDSEELFGRPVDTAAVRRCLRRALDPGNGDASVRIDVFSAAGDDVVAGRAVTPDVLVRTGPPQPKQRTPLRLRTAAYERFLPHVKNASLMGQILQWRHARAAGYDDVLFVDRHGRVSEGSLWNVVVSDRDGLRWPDAAALPGITQQLVRAGLGRLGTSFRVAPVHLSEVPSLRAAAVMNSVTPAVPVAEIDGRPLALDTGLVAMLTAAYEAIEPDDV